MDRTSKSKLTMILKGVNIFGLSFLGDCATITRTPLVKILISGVNIPVLFYRLLVDKVVYLMSVKKRYLHL